MNKHYSETLMQHYQHPQGVGKLDEALSNVSTGWAGTAENGDVIRLQILVEHGMIKEACFKAQGTCATIAAGSWLVDWLKDRAITEAKAFNCETLIDALKLPQTSRHSALLAHDALRKALAGLVCP